MMQFTEEQRKALSQERLKELLSYDPMTGLFTWVTYRGSNARPGHVAGSVNAKGYINIQVDSRYYKAHRLAFLYMEGVMPGQNIEVDHRDMDKQNNRWDNLRKATKGQNQCNKLPPSRSKSGVKGVTWNEENSRWRVTLKFERKQYHFGYYSDFELATLVSQEARSKYHGEFAR